MELSFRDLIGDPCRGGRERGGERGRLNMCMWRGDKIFMILFYNSQLSFPVSIFGAG